jgi:hypothetical protein
MGFVARDWQGIKEEKLKYDTREILKPPEEVFTWKFAFTVINERELVR